MVSQAMRFRVLAMLEMDCGTILGSTGLVGRIGMTACSGVCEGKMGKHWSVRSSALMNVAGREMWEKRGGSTVFGVGGKDKTGRKATGP